MLWYTITSEIATKVLENPNDFKYLFTNNSDKKQQIIMLVSNETDININHLTNSLNKVIKNKEFMNLVCDTQFTSDVPNSNQAIQMTFAYMAMPFFDYMTTRCGIPSSLPTVLSN